MDGGGRMDRWTKVRPWRPGLHSKLQIQRDKAIWRENGINRSGPSGLMAFIRCYSRDRIGILAVSTEGWLLCKKISIQSWPFVKLSRNRNEYFMMSGVGHSDEGNRLMVQTAMSPRWIGFRIDRNFYCEISRVRGLIFLTPLQRILTDWIL